MINLAERMEIDDTYFTHHFERDALAILQEFDAQNQPICAETTPTEEPLVFTVGELYEDRDGAVYGFIGYNPWAMSADKEALFSKKENPAFIHERWRNGSYGFLDIESHRDKDIIIKHTPNPVQHEIIFWVNVYDGDDRLDIYLSKEDADQCACGGRIACLHIKRTFVEGEGL